MRILIFTSLLLLCFSCKKEKPTEIQQPNFKYYDFFSSSLRATAVISSRTFYHFGYSTNGQNGALLVQNIETGTSEIVPFMLNSMNLSSQAVATLNYKVYVAVNSTYTGTNKYDPILMIFNDVGELQNTIQYFDTKSEVVQDIIVTKDDNLLIFSIDGDNPTNVILRKCDSNGNEIWVKYIETSYYSYNSKIIELNDGTFAFAANASTGKTLVITKLYPYNNSSYAQFFTFSPNLNQIKFICKNSDGTLTLASAVNQKLWMAKIDLASSETVWEKLLGLDNVSLNCSAITNLKDGTYAVTGACFGSNTRNQDVFYAHIGEQGEALQYKVFGGVGSDFPQHITHIGNNELYISGEYTGTNIFNNGRALFNVRLKADGTFLP